MGKVNFFVILFLVVIALHFSSAKLVIQNDNNFTVVGDVGESVPLSIEVENTGDKILYNITLEQNENIRNPETIEKLNVGEVKELKFKVYITDDVNLKLALQGVYIEDIGTSSDNYTFNIYNEDQAGIPIEHRNMNVYVGDKIIFANHVSDWVDLFDVKSSKQIRQINEGENYTKYCDTPEEISYVIRRRGSLDLTSVFTLNVLSTTGAVHDPLTDAFLYIKIKPNHDPTIISPTFIDTDFSLKFYKTTETAVVLKNTGNKEAYVNLRGDWMKFSKNDFVIEPEQSISVTLTIDLNKTQEAEFDDSNKTNKSFTKYLKITGNFPSISKAMNIFIQYTKVVDGEIPQDTPQDFIGNLVKQIEAFCVDYPESTICSKTYYTGYDPNSDIITLNGSRYSIQEILSTSYDTKDTVEKSLSLYGDKVDKIETKVSSIDNSVGGSINNVNKELSDLKDSNAVTNTIIITFILSILITGLIMSLLTYKKMIENKKKVRGQFN